MAADLRIACPIDRIGLFESLTGGGPARYEPIELVRLGAGLTRFVGLSGGVSGGTMEDPGPAIDSPLRGVPRSP